ncbi:helix-turn-helix transcriptional regulator [Agromyces aerolatus]|uniref:helix-turn-helix transcriptional regulator n=1 Tax=Agromyces sp. LY-1074 TaxID=3074080 RepID=UPI002865D5AB|nr:MULTISPECIES: WYL domain-containing protein [unclassified Agromyces]MDR5699544.1 WYL domain-containing protein [Agromyces sp. LY-1074]MDR5705840.1 WYL domain-containing protein [Agromyces sp. LY-1358]
MAGATSRLLTLLSLLQSRRDWPGQVLADRLDVSARTVRRDIDRLRELGYRIQAMKGPDGGYRLDAGSELPPLLFDDDQALAIAVALQTAPATGAAIDEAASRALATVRQVMPSRLRHRIDGVRFTNIPAGRAPAMEPQVLIAISAAVRAREVVRFDYRPVGEDAEDEAPPRRVEPHHVVARAGRWYLVGWDLEREDWRMYRLDRMSPRVPTGPRFGRREVPGGDVGAFVESRFMGSDRPDRWPCEGTVVLALPARDVAPFAPEGTVEAVDADHCRLRAGSWSWVALAASIGRFDAAVSEVAPPELAAAFRTLAARYADARPPRGRPTRRPAVR